MATTPHPRTSLQAVRDLNETDVDVLDPGTPAVDEDGYEIDPRRGLYSREQTARIMGGHRAVLRAVRRLPRLSFVQSSRGWVAEQAGHVGSGASQTAALRDLDRTTRDPITDPAVCPSCGGDGGWDVSEVRGVGTSTVAGFRPLRVECQDCDGGEA